jgi:hypothetical protein
VDDWSGSKLWDAFAQMRRGQRQTTTRRQRSQLPQLNPR